MGIGRCSLLSQHLFFSSRFRKLCRMYAKMLFVLLIASVSCDDHRSPGGGPRGNMTDFGDDRGNGTGYGGHGGNMTDYGDHAGDYHGNMTDHDGHDYGQGNGHGNGHDNEHEYGHMSCSDRISKCDAEFDGWRWGKYHDCLKMIKEYYWYDCDFNERGRLQATMEYVRNQMRMSDDWTTAGSEMVAVSTAVTVTSLVAFFLTN